MTCKHCRKFFARFRCSADSHGECDCPKCQGYCTCNAELIKRLQGCPNGATRDALLACGHTNIEIDAAVNAGDIIREVRTYSMPRGFEVEWFEVPR